MSAAELRELLEAHDLGCSTTGEIPFPCDCGVPELAAAVVAELVALRATVERQREALALLADAAEG